MTALLTCGNTVILWYSVLPSNKTYILYWAVISIRWKTLGSIHYFGIYNGTNPYNKWTVEINTYTSEVHCGTTTLLTSPLPAAIHHRLSNPPAPGSWNSQRFQCYWHLLQQNTTDPCHLQQMEIWTIKAWPSILPTLPSQKYGKYALQQTTLLAQPQVLLPDILPYIT